MSLFLILFLAVDAVITVSVLLFLLRRRNGASGGNEAVDAFGSPRTTDATRPPGASGSFARLFGGGQLRGLAAFAAEQDQRIGDYVRANWSGVPDQLPAVLGALVGELERDAQAKGLSFDRETLKSMLAGSLRSHHIGGGHDVLEALEKVS